MLHVHLIVDQAGFKGGVEDIVSTDVEDYATMVGFTWLALWVDATLTNATGAVIGSGMRMKRDIQHSWNERPPSPHPEEGSIEERQI